MAKGSVTYTRTGFDAVPDKRYAVNGIEEIFTKDDQGNPIFKLYDNNFTQQKELKIGIKLRTQTGEDGPAMFLLPAEFVALVHMFGGSDFFPAKGWTSNSAVLLSGMNKANAGAKVVGCESKGGYVNTYNFPELHPPKGQYKVQFKEAFSPKNPGTYFFSEGGNDSQYIILKFEIVEGPFEGFVTSVFMNNCFVDYQEINGEIYSAMDGAPVAPMGKTYQRWEALGTYFVPGLWENYDWEIDPSKSQYGVCETKQPQVVIISKMLEAKQVVNVWYEKKERKDEYWFDPLNLEMFNPKPAIVQEVTLQDFVDYVKSKTWTYEDASGDTHEFENIFESENPLVFVTNEEGKSLWARQYLGGEVGPWVAAGLDPNKTDFASLGSQQLAKLLEEMKARYN